MGSRRKVRAGQTITLRAKIQDDIGENAQASGVIVHIFQPGHDLQDLNTANVISGVATFFDEGIHEFQYTVPSCGPNGVWTDLWYGTLNCQVLSGIFNFQVSASGQFEALGDQLNINNVVEVSIPSGITAKDGSKLTEEHSFTFLTETSPAYSNTRKVRLEVGAWVEELEEDTIQLGILEASIEADLISFGKIKNRPLYEHARREWSTCKTGLLLLSNLGNTTLRSKTLGDLHVEYDNRGLRESIMRLQNCMDRWEPQIIAGGGLRSSQQPQFVVKGSSDIDRPPIGRESFSTVLGFGDNNIPAANTKLRLNRSRRFRSTFLSQPGKKWWGK